jgi:hypothetical protein
MLYHIIALIQELERKLDRILREKQEANALLSEIAQRLREVGG